jgi:hypothetical protein
MLDYGDYNGEHNTYQETAGSKPSHYHDIPMRYSTDPERLKLALSDAINYAICNTKVIKIDAPNPDNSEQRIRFNVYPNDTLKDVVKTYYEKLAEFKPNGAGHNATITAPVQQQLEL